jgi:hypothetical protein
MPNPVLDDFDAGSVSYATRERRDHGHFLSSRVVEKRPRRCDAGYHPSRAC